MFKILMKISICFFLIGVLGFGFFTSTVKADNDIINGGLRTDSAQITNSLDYRAWLMAFQIPNTYNPLNPFTTDWLSFTGLNYPESFTQIGLIGWYNDGPYWFVEAPKGSYPGGPYMMCLQGSGFQHPYGNGFWSGCKGASITIGQTLYNIRLGQWYKVEFAYDSVGIYWIARVYINSQDYADVAKIYADTVNVHDVNTSFEEGFGGSSSPNAWGQFFQSYPEYKVTGTGFVTWPQSTYPLPSPINDNENVILAASSFCPSVYAASPNQYRDEYVWYGGSVNGIDPSYGPVCNGWILYPIKAVSGNIITSNNTAYIEFETDPSHWIHSSCTPSWYRTFLCSESWTTTLNDYYVLTFNGSSITRIYVADNRGVANIYLDGKYIESYGDSITPVPRWQVARTYSVSPGDHTILVYYRQPGVLPSLDLNAFYVDIPYVLPQNSPFDDFDTADITYFGNASSDWTAATGPSWVNFYRDTLHYNNTPQDGFRFTFQGNYIKLTYPSNYNWGIAGIVIDGYEKPQLSMWSSSLVYSNTITYGPLPSFPGNGIHTIEMTCLGQKDPRSTDPNPTDYYIGIDRIDVW